MQQRLQNSAQQKRPSAEILCISSALVSQLRVLSIRFIIQISMASLVWKITSLRTKYQDTLVSTSMSILLDLLTIPAKKNLPSYISHSTILDNNSQARGWAISLAPIPTTFLTAQPAPSTALSHTIGLPSTTAPRTGSSKIQFADPQVRAIITAGCSTVITAEPTITEYDTIVGDGDCGYTLRDGAKQVLSFISTADLSQLPSTLSSLVDDLEVNMGGTSGALYCIFLSSLAQNLWDAPTFAEALKGALEHLMKYTRARLGDRTCLDCLIPFVETLGVSEDSEKALEDAEKGVESTKKLEAKLGRSSYLDEAATRGVPDPGAYGLLVLLQGMVGAEQ